MPMPAFRMTYPTAMVLQALDAGYRYGFEIADATGLRPGSVYHVLRRLEDGGHAEGEWEPPDPAHREGRPPRRYYRLTGEEARALLDEARRRFPSLADVPGGRSAEEGRA